MVTHWIAMEMLNLNLRFLELCRTFSTQDLKKNKFRTGVKSFRKNRWPMFTVKIPCINNCFLDHKLTRRFLKYFWLWESATRRFVWILSGLRSDIFRLNSQKIGEHFLNHSFLRIQPRHIGQIKFKYVDDIQIWFRFEDLWGFFNKFGIIKTPFCGDWERFRC